MVGWPEHRKYFENMKLYFVVTAHDDGLGIKSVGLFHLILKYQTLVLTIERKRLNL